MQSILHPHTLTRIAPTPSGFLHTGNLLSFSITAWLARESGARILLRIDDLDTARARESYIDDIFACLRALSMSWHAGPIDKADYLDNFSQQKRTALYNKLLDELRQKNAVYACRCSRIEISERSANGISTCDCKPQRLPLDAANVNWRLDTCSKLLLEVRNIDGSVIKKELPPAMQDFVVRRKDGSASYQLASVADDCYFKTDLIVRGEDLWHSTLAQLYLATLAGKQTFLTSAFFHHPLLKDEAGGKLSKSAGSTSLQYLLQKGYSASSIYQLTAKQAGLYGDAYDWSSLAALFMENYDGASPGKQ